ncbi:cytochrome C biogenesis protein [Rathayibacter toxicus]|uniref:Cytochrome C biogenesis protein n=1 Tax=Rathayibacter toxicus TaxID=145458 RepID=A0A2S5Y5L1_9MICO|nr:cytochrome C biogenesis protein [Rathayibacter toxicus]PPG46072.1 cytochrome C biogenesis protein [Rathayibacter toxicus]PPH21891.1 cytochrome C biogenesis protein [Rathayibacter toxicus]PPH56411.1 cytochrome C biogenesis protein [Rathayibacter toxicus]PPH58507.1 cytochrome C biogenesis protein [Rathayibacter toxicus]
MVISGQLLLAVPLALLAGIVSFASPCILPLVPGYLAYVGGFTDSDERAAGGRHRVVLGVLLFVLGFSLVFVLYGVAAGSLGSWMREYTDAITRLLGVFVIVMGLVFIGQLSFLQRTVRPNIRPTVGLIGAPLLGIGFGVGWTPCLGPTLSSIIALSYGVGSPWRGAALALVYCLGLGLPFLFVALGFSWVSSTLAFVKRHLRTVNIAGGVALVLIGVLMVTGVWNTLVFGVLAGVIGDYRLPL